MNRVAESVKFLIKRSAFACGINMALVRLLSFPIVLGYHRIIEPDESLLVARIGSVSPKDFEGHLEYLLSLGCRFDTLDVILESRSSRSVAITFDDGFRDLYTNAFPILRNKGVPFALFLITSLVDLNSLLWQHQIYRIVDGLPSQKRRDTVVAAIAEACGEAVETYSNIINIDEALSFIISSMRKAEIVAMLGLLMERNGCDICFAGIYLSRDDLREMIDCGLTVESHGAEHWNLKNLSQEDLGLEIELAAHSVYLYFNQSPFAYAVAHGISNASVLFEIEKNGYKKIMTGDYGLYSKPGSRYVPRIWPQGSTLEFSWMLTKVLLNAAVKSGFESVTRLAKALF